MAQRRTVSSGSDYESVVGYSRAVRTGRHIVVAAPPATGRNHRKTREALRRIEIALQQPEDHSPLVRTRIYVTDISLWEEVGAVHAEMFGEMRPVATMVEVSALISPDLLVEIEVDAYPTPSR